MRFHSHRKAADYRKKMAERARRGWVIRHARMIAAEPPERPRRNELGLYLGALQWHGADGEVHRWRVFQAARKNQITVRGAREDHGWDWLLDRLRAKLAPLTR